MAQKYSKIINNIAKKEGISPSIVYAEMMSAIEICSKNSNKSFHWNKISSNGKLPTPDEFIASVASIMKENGHNDVVQNKVD